MISSSRLNISPLRPVRVSWSAGLVVLCRDCTGSAAKKLRKRLKKRLPATIRVVESSCLNVCPKNGTAACIIDRRSGETVTAIVRDDADLDALTAEIERCGTGRDDVA